MPGSPRHATSLLVVAAPGIDLAAARRVRARLAAAWPRPSVVAIDVVPLAGGGTPPQRVNATQPPAVASEGDGLGPEQIASMLYGHAAVVLLTARPELSPDLVGVLERAERLHIPVVRLSAAEDRRERREFWAAARGGCVPLLPLDSDPALVVGITLGLVATSGSRRELLAELEVERAVKDSAAKLLEHNQSETALAVLVQRALLPAPPREVPGLDAAVLYRPCCSLSGDLYDIVRLDDDHVAFFLADACGHGVAAALLTMLIGRLLPMKEAIEPGSLSIPHPGSAAPEGTRIIPPGEAMSRLNAAYLQRQPESSRLITAMYGVLHLPTGRLALASAGHPPAAITGADGLRLAGESGPSLGLMEDAEFPETVIHLSPGDTVMFYSDGFEWAFDGPEAQHQDPATLPVCSPHRPPSAADCRRPNERYLEAFGAIRPTTPGLLQETIFELAGLMDQQRGSLHQPDDITLLAFTWRDAAAAAEGHDLASAA